MSVVTYEGFLEGGQLKLPGGARLPDRGKVYVVVTSEEPVSRGACVLSPRLVRREDAQAFRMEVSEDPEHAWL